MSIETASRLEEHVAASINAEREAEGLAPLKVEAHLNAAAQAHSDWMAETGRLSHTGEGGSSAGDRIAETGFDFSGQWGWAENLAYTSISGGLDRGEADLMHDGLMDSAGHRANILKPDISYVGIGLSKGSLTFGGIKQDVVFLTQKFAETEGEVLVQHEVDGETVLQPWQNGAPAGEPLPPEEVPDERDRDDDDGGGGGGCFVATAAYGDRLHPEVVALRRWRDERLVRHAAGRVFIRVYRILGPRLAGVVAAERGSGRAARALIAPLARWVGRRR